MRWLSGRPWPPAARLRNLPRLREQTQRELVPVQLPKPRFVVAALLIRLDEGSN
jgi:hypothetical protein